MAVESVMHRLNKAKDARRRARKQAQKAIHAHGVAITAQRVIPDKRRKPEKHKKRNEAMDGISEGVFYATGYRGEE